MVRFPFAIFFFFLLHSHILLTPLVATLLATNITFLLRAYNTRARSQSRFYLLKDSQKATTALAGNPIEDRIVNLGGMRARADHDRLAGVIACMQRQGCNLI